MQDVWFTPARIADFTEAVKQAVAEGQALIIQTGSYESLEANPWSLHVLQFTEASSLELGRWVWAGVSWEGFPPRNWSTCSLSLPEHYLGR